MKRLGSILLVLVLFTFLPAATLAQPSLEKGFKAGLYVSKLGGDVSGLDSKIGLAFGGFLALPVSPLVAVQAEALYSQRGAKETVAAVDDQGKRVPARDLLHTLVERLTPVARELGALAELEDTLTLWEKGPSYLRQRRITDAIRDARIGAPPQRRRFGLPIFAGLGVAAAAAVLLLVVRPFGGTTESAVVARGQISAGETTLGEGAALPTGPRRAYST